MPTAENTTSDATRSGKGPKSELEHLAQSRDPGIVREFWDFLREEKKWWLGPIVVVLLLLAAVAFVAVSPAAPFIYTIF
jgi:hypothetical protein